MKTGNDWLDGMHNHSAALDSVACELRDLGRAFMRTGNESAAAELFEHAQALSDEAKRASDLTAARVNSDYRDAVAASTNLLKALLAGGELAKRDK